MHIISYKKIDKEISYQTSKGEYFFKILPEMLGEYGGLKVNYPDLSDGAS